MREVANGIGGEAFRAWRKRHGWTQHQAARQLQVSQGIISEWERVYRGRKIPPYIIRLTELIDEVEYLRRDLAIAQGAAPELVQIRLDPPPDRRRLGSRVSHS